MEGGRGKIGRREVKGGIPGDGRFVFFPSLLETYFKGQGTQMLVFCNGTSRGSGFETVLVIS